MTDAIPAGETPRPETKAACADPASPDRVFDTFLKVLARLDPLGGAGASPARASAPAARPAPIAAPSSRASRGGRPGASARPAAAAKGRAGR